MLVEREILRFRAPKGSAEECPPRCPLTPPPCECSGLRGRTASFSSITEAFPLLRTQSSQNPTDTAKNERLWSLMSSYLASGARTVPGRLVTAARETLAPPHPPLVPDVKTIQRSIANHVEYTLASSRFDFDQLKAYLATAHRYCSLARGSLMPCCATRLPAAPSSSVRDRLLESWNDTNQYFEQLQVKRVSYLSLEFLIGRAMQVRPSG